MSRARVLAIALTVALGIGCGGPETGPADAAPDAPGCRADADCDDGLFCTGEERCAPASPSADARGCVILPSCTALQACDEAGDLCTTDCGVTRDADGDGARASECGGNDCDDANAAVHPGATEICDPDDLDEDCDPATFGERDGDSDGALDASCCNRPAGSAPVCGTDCDDARAGVHPGEAEECDGLDGDCDGAIDELVQATFTRDADADGHASDDPAAETMLGCDPPPGFASATDDCDDADASIHPGAYDRCDGTVDDDCSGAIDDPPAGCACADGDARSCPLPGVCAGSTQTCTSGVWGACGRAATEEICGNDLDEDCDGAADDGCTCTIALRACGIDEGACVRGVQRCLADGLWTACDGSTDPSPEICNGIDDDCDGATDEELTRICWDDPDGDGYAWPSATTTSACGACPAGTTARDPSVAGNVDCDGDDPRAFPGQTAFFSAERTTSGGFDFDCDGALVADSPGSSCQTNAAGTGCVVARVWTTNTGQCGQYVGWNDCYYMGPELGCQGVTGCTPGVGSNCMRLSCR